MLTGFFSSYFTDVNCDSNEASKDFASVNSDLIGMNVARSCDLISVYLARSCDLISKHIDSNKEL